MSADHDWTGTTHRRRPNGRKCGGAIRVVVSRSGERRPTCAKCGTTIRTTAEIKSTLYSATSRK